MRPSDVLRLSPAALLLALAGPAWAAGSSMPWEAPLQKILDSVADSRSGPRKRAVRWKAPSLFRTTPGPTRAVHGR